MNPIQTIRAGALAALLVTAACASDTVTSPTFGSGCSVGTISPGDTVIGRLTEASCVNPYDIYSNGEPSYETYAVHLVAGRGYMFAETHIPDTAAAGLDDIDPLLELWGALPNGTSLPLAISDDEAGSSNSVIYFIAPVTGTYRLVVGAFWGGELGGYRLTASECPVIASLDTAGTYALALQASPCIRSRAGGISADTAAFVLVSYDAAAHEQVTLSASSAAFTPTWESFGPGFDTYSNVFAATRATFGRGNGVTGSMQLDSLGGPMTLAIGGTAKQTSGAFSVTLARVPPASPPAPSTRWSIAGLGEAALRPAKAKTP